MKKYPQYDRPLKEEDRFESMPRPMAEEIDEFGDDEIILPRALELAIARINESNQNG